MKRLVLGPRAVVESLRSKRAELSALYYERGKANAFAELLEEARVRGLRPDEQTREQLDALAGGPRHQGVIAVAGPYPYADLEAVLQAEAPLLIALDQITDPHNLGAIVRSAVAFGADGVLTLKDRAAPVTPVVVRASAGATEHARIVRVTNLARTLAQLTARDIDVVGLDADGEGDLSDLGPAPFGRALVVGAEGKGLRRLVRERCSRLLRIDQVGPVASLNASVAAGIALHAARAAR